MAIVWFATLNQWSGRSWLTAAAAALGTLLLIAIPTAMIANPIFGRAVEVTGWSWPALIITSVLAGILIASYLQTDAISDVERPLRLGSAGGILSFLAVGCPVCNKLVLIALGTSGAMNYFAPVQPVLAVVGILFLGYALKVRLENLTTCTIPAAKSNDLVSNKGSENGNN